MFSVFDGHGSNGQIVSFVLKKSLADNISNNLVELTPEGIKTAVNKGCYVTNNEILKSGFDSYLSGSTAINILIHKNMLISANVGDSRAIMGKMSIDGKWKYCELSHDHKPEIE